jgi:hypothetical protein
MTVHSQQPIFLYYRPYFLGLAKNKAKFPAAINPSMEALAKKGIIFLLAVFL